MSRRKQAAPQRRITDLPAAQDHTQQEQEQEELREDEGPSQPQAPKQQAPGSTLFDPCSHLRRIQCHSSYIEELSAFAELLVTTKASIAADAAEEQHRASPEPRAALDGPVGCFDVQLLDSSSQCNGKACAHEQDVLQLSWQVPGQPADVRHQVCCVLPRHVHGPSLMMLLQQGHMGVVCTQLQCPGRPAGQDKQHSQQRRPATQQEHVRDSSSMADAAVTYEPGWVDMQADHQQQQVQFCTFEVPNSFLQTFQCDVLMPPEAAEVAAAMQQCIATAVAAAAAKPGKTGSSSCNLPVVPLLPSRHVSLMAAAAMPELVRQQQQQPGVPAAAEASGTDAAATTSSDDEAAAEAGLSFWQLHVGITPAGMSAHTASSADFEDRQRQHLASLSDAWLWLVPHWLPHRLPKPWQQQLLQPQQHQCVGSSSRRSSSRFDAAVLYSAVKPRGDEPMLQQQPVELLPLLRPYQRRAAAWMLASEGVQQQQQHGQYEMQQAAGIQGKQHAVDLSLLVQQQLHPLWRCALLLPPPAAAAVQAAATSGSSSSPGSAGSASSAGQQDLDADCKPDDALAAARDVDTAAAAAGGCGGVLYFCPYTAKVSVEAFAAPRVSGGILADEMGLGKTVELLALMAAHRLPRVKQQQLPAAAAGSGGSSRREGRERSRHSSSSSRSNGSGSGCCSRCGELLEGPCYAEGGLIPQKQQQQGRPQRQQQQKRGRRQQRYASGSSCDSDGVSEQDDEEARDVYVSARDTRQVGRKSKRHQQQKRQQQEQQHGAGHHGAKRQKRSSAQQQFEEEEEDDDDDEDEEEEEEKARQHQRQQQQQTGAEVDQLLAPWGSKAKRSSRGRSAAWTCQKLGDTEQQEQQQQQCDSSEQGEEEKQRTQHQQQRRPGRAGRAAGAGAGAADAAADADDEPGGEAAAAAAGGRGSGGMLCGCCLREMALQEVSGECGTTLIVVPSNILVQWVDELQRHIRPGALSLKVYVGQYQPGSTPAPAAPAASKRTRRSSSDNGSARGTAAAAAAASAAAAAAAAGRVVTAAELAAADIVLTTYDVLKRELALQPDSNAASEYSFRRRKRYTVVPTPLSRLRFFRLVMDEAQQVQGSTAKAAEMARKIHARHRWAVTGTPISRGLEDLWGLLSCLGVKPWASSTWWWRTAIAEPLQRGEPHGLDTLLRLMAPARGGLLWRSAKADVLAEMGLPQQFHHTTLLRLSAIQRHWYNRAHQDCAAKARKVLQESLAASILHSRGGSRTDAAAAAAKATAAAAAAAAIAAGGDGRALDSASAAVLGPLLGRQLVPAEQKKLLLPLLRLRQACIHPQVGASGLRGTAIGGSNSSSPMTMDQVLQVLITKARTEAEEAQRQLIGALNGLAALLRLSGDTTGAVAAYRQGLAVSEANKQEVRTDPLQLLHTLHNLADLLAHLAAKFNSSGAATADAAADGGHTQQPQGLPAPAGAAPVGSYGPGIPRTLRDDSLESEAAAIRDSYLAQRQAALAAAHSAFCEAAKEALPVLQRQHQHKAKAQGVQAGAGADGSSKAAGTGGSSWQRSAGGSGSGMWQRAMMGIGDDDGDDSDSWLEQDLQEDDLAGEQFGTEVTAGASAAAGAGVGGGAAGFAGWYVAVIDALVDAGRDEEVAELVRQKLQEGDTYRQKTQQNATSLANRFATLHGLKLLISQELGAMAAQQAAAMGQLQELQEACSAPGGPEEGLVEQAGQCGRCRAEMGVAGLVCRHCRLDEGLRRWEVRLFSLHTRALVAGRQVDADEAARQSHVVATRRVGRGGLNEAAAEGSGDDDLATAAAGAGARRQDTAVSETQVVRHPSEVERVLRLLQQQLGRHGLARELPGVQEAALQHLECLEGSRKLFIAAGALSVAQRQLLYALDELAMALLRISTRMEGEQVTAHEALFKLTEAEQVIKNSELSLEKTLAQGELNRALGKLRYLKTIASARKRAAAAAAAAATGASADGGAAARDAGDAVAGAAEAGAAAAANVAGGGSGLAAGEQAEQVRAAAPLPPAEPASPRTAAAAAALKRAAVASGGGRQQQDTGGMQQGPGAAHRAPAPSAAAAAAPAPPAGDSSVLGAEQTSCPICHDQVEAAAAVLPCGHVLCCSCADELVARLPAALPQPQRRINCPTCRCRTHVSDVAYVDSGCSSTYSYIRTDSSVPGQHQAGDPCSPVASPRAGAGRAGRRSSSSSSGAVGEAGECNGCGGRDAGRGSTYPWQAEQQLVVQGSYGTKVEAIVRRLLLLLQLDTANKVIVFSSWLDVLDILSHALTANGVAHAFGRGRKGFLQALEQFKGCAVAATAAGAAAVVQDGGGDAGGQAAGQPSSSSGSHLKRRQQGWLGNKRQREDQEGGAGQTGEQIMIGREDEEAEEGSGEMEEDNGEAGGSAAAAPAGSCAAAGAGVSAAAAYTRPRVLLMLVTHGAAGLNLTEAQHVVLVEPLLDPAQELQATGRISRFGQTATTHVHRFVVQHTVEENVARMSRQRAAAMDMPAAAPARRPGGGGSSSSEAALTVADVAALLSSKWGEGSSGNADTPAGAGEVLVEVQE